MRAFQGKQARVRREGETESHFCQLSCLSNPVRTNAQRGRLSGVRTYRHTIGVCSSITTALLPLLDRRRYDRMMYAKILLEHTHTHTRAKQNSLWMRSSSSIYARQPDVVFFGVGASNVRTRTYCDLFWPRAAAVALLKEAQRKKAYLY